MSDARQHLGTGDTQRQAQGHPAADNETSDAISSVTQKQAGLPHSARNPSKRPECLHNGCSRATT